MVQEELRIGNWMNSICEINDRDVRAAYKVLAPLKCKMWDVKDLECEYEKIMIDMWQGPSSLH